MEVITTKHTHTSMSTCKNWCWMAPFCLVTRLGISVHGTATIATEQRKKATMSRRQHSKPQELVTQMWKINLQNFAKRYKTQDSWARKKKAQSQIRGLRNPTVLRTAMDFKTKQNHLRAGGMAQDFRALAALQDPSSVPGTHRSNQNLP